MNQKVLLTGGAGYIGSHVGLYLAEAGYDVIVFDNCSTGTPESVLFGELVVGDLSDVELLLHTLINHQISKVMHFAASISVPESVLRPLDYYGNNTRNTLNLLQCCNKVGVKEFVFSSTAAVYGQAEENPLKESSKTVPMNPYGRSKLMSEWMIQDAGQASNLNYVILRYFNVSGADSKGRIGSYSRNANHLIDNACKVVLHHQSHLKVFGIDFPTVDGTGVRDYIHVQDLALAHIAALNYLENGGSSQILNCGYGVGYSVLEVVERVKVISGIDIPLVIESRRPGDPACVIAHAEKIKHILDWHPHHDNLDDIISTALEWKKKNVSIK
ncbi:MAG: UDP-glucose 4-epimerase GalE [Cyanobacteria bacterium REEB444]|nr:UDP-glucose 4-epimerase GalE [Cyanobacteria bacterium REEB444]